jgi:hypothetical protein
MLRTTNLSIPKITVVKLTTTLVHSLDTREVRPAAAGTLCEPGYCVKVNAGPLTRLPVRSTVTSTRSAILMKGMPLFIP